MRTVSKPDFVGIRASFVLFLRNPISINQDENYRQRRSFHPTCYCGGNTLFHVLSPIFSLVQAQGLNPPTMAPNNIIDWCLLLHKEGNATASLYHYHKYVNVMTSVWTVWETLCMGRPIYHPLTRGFGGGFGH